MTKSTCGPSLANQSPSGHHLLHVTTQDKLPFGHHPFPSSPYPPLISRTKTLPWCCPTLPPAKLRPQPPATLLLESTTAKKGYKCRRSPWQRSRRWRRRRRRRRGAWRA